MTSASSNLVNLYARLRPFGLNVTGVASPTSYDAAVAPARRTSTLHPGTQAVVVVGSGGSELWDAFVRAVQADPSLLTNEAHPLDAFARRAVESADVVFEAIPRRWFFAAASADVHLDFRLLAQQAGLGARSRLGLLLNPTFGTWLGLRAACLLSAAVALSPSADEDPCLGCPGYCAAACPGDAFPQAVWDVDRCGAFHTEGSPCATTCHARVACPLGAAHAYPVAERTYHYNRRLGRQLLRESLAVEEDRYEGEGPFWSVWRGRIDVKG